MFKCAPPISYRGVGIGKNHFIRFVIFGSKRTVHGLEKVPANRDV